MDNRIDYSKYQVDELAATISDAVFFPLYIGKVFGLVLLVFICALTIFSSLFISSTFLSIVFWVITFVVSLPSVILFSVIRLFSTIQSDIEKVYKITLQTAKHVYKDSGVIKTQRKEKTPIKHTFSDVFKGVGLFVIKPVLCKVLERRIKFFSYPFIIIINLIFKKIIIKKTATSQGLQQLESYAVSDEEITKNYKLSSTTFKVFKFPFRLVLILYGFVNFCLVYMLYVLFS